MENQQEEIKKPLKNMIDSEVFDYIEQILDRPDLTPSAKRLYLHFFFCAHRTKNKVIEQTNYNYLMCSTGLKKSELYLAKELLRKKGLIHQENLGRKRKYDAQGKAMRNQPIYSITLRIFNFYKEEIELFEQMTNDVYERECRQRIVDEVEEQLEKEAIEKAKLKLGQMLITAI